MELVWVKMRDNDVVRGGRSLFKVVLDRLKLKEVQRGRMGIEDIVGGRMSCFEVL